ncbi:hypothetical protein K493DRAFT_369824, partial [Basidiobolus meristosporus CBS 931.73]
MGCRTWGTLLLEESSRSHLDFLLSDRNKLALRQKHQPDARSLFKVTETFTKFSSKRFKNALCYGLWHPHKKSQTPHIQGATPQFLAPLPLKAKRQKEGSGILMNARKMKELAPSPNNLYTPPRPTTSLPSNSNPLNARKGKGVERPSVSGTLSENTTGKGLFNQGAVSRSALKNIAQRPTSTPYELTTFFEPTEMSPRCYESPRVQMDISHEDPLTPSHSATPSKAVSRYPLVKQPPHTDTTHERASSLGPVISSFKRPTATTSLNYGLQNSQDQRDVFSVKTKDKSARKATGLQNTSKPPIETSGSEQASQFLNTFPDNIPSPSPLMDSPVASPISQGAEMSDETSLQPILTTDSIQPTQPTLQTKSPQDDVPIREVPVSPTISQPNRVLLPSSEDNFISIHRKI